MNQYFLKVLQSKYTAEISKINSIVLKILLDIDVFNIGDYVFAMHEDFENFFLIHLE